MSADDPVITDMKPIAGRTMSFMSVITGSSALIVEIYGYSVTEFGYIFALAGLAILIGSDLNRRLLRRFNSMQLTGVGAVMIGASGVQLLGMAWLGEAPFAWVWGSVCLYMGGSSFLMANATAMALDPVPHVAGAAASIIGTTQNLCAAGSAVLTGILYDGTMPTAVIVMGAFGTVTLVVFLGRGLILRDEPQPATSD